MCLGDFVILKLVHFLLILLQNVADIKKLKQSGICTIKVKNVAYIISVISNMFKITLFKFRIWIWMKLYDVLMNHSQGVQMTTRKKLCNIKGISEAKMEKIKEAANKLCVSLRQ